VSECVDSVTGKRYPVGSEFAPHTAEQRDRLKRAGCLKERDAPKRRSSSQKTMHEPQWPQDDR